MTLKKELRRKGSSSNRKLSLDEPNTSDPIDNMMLIPDETFRLLVESVPNGIIITDKAGKIVFINSEAEKIFGYSRYQLIGDTVEKLMPENYRRKHVAYRNHFAESPTTRPMGKGMDLYAVRSNGERFPVEIGLNYVDSQSGRLIISTIVDITKRRNTEKLLNDREFKLRQIMDNTSDAIIVFDEIGLIETLNTEAAKLFCGSGKESINKIWEIITPENRENFSYKLRKVSEGKRITDYETERLTKDGRRITVSISLVAMNEGEKFIETIRDISDRVLMRNKIVELEKSQIIGKMAEGFAHHMGTPLASMLLRVQMLKEDMSELPECEDVLDKLNSVEKQILYGQKVIQRLLKFVGRPRNEKSLENISILLEEAIEMIKPILKKKKIRIKTEIEKNLYILGDTSLIQLVFSDIMMNSADAMADGGLITIRALWSEKRDSITVEIEDTGTGISKETIPYVFEPFFTTKPAGRGTGLGLSVAKRIVQNHDGEITLNSKQGIGTSVLIKFPIIEKEINE
jgi:PAS domain S-box-containing protein